MFRFAHPQYFYLLLLIPVLAALYFWVWRDYRRRLSLFGDNALIRSLMPEAAPHKALVKYCLVTVAVAVLVFALAGPQVGSRLRKVKTEGVEIILAVDVSNSMLAEDFEPSRLARTKMAITKLVDGLTEDRIGLVVFAGDAFVQLPVTGDYVTAKNLVSHLSPDMVSSQGTAIGKALRAAGRSFSSQSDRSRVVIVISDGEDHDADAVDVARQMADKGIVVHTVGVGSPEGAPVSVEGEMLRDSDGQIVVSRLNEKLLQDIAFATGGSYVHATGGSMGLDGIIRQVRDMDAQELVTDRFEEYSEQYRYLVAIALVIILIESCVLDRKNRMVERMTLFHKENENTKTE